MPGGDGPAMVELMVTYMAMDAPPAAAPRAAPDGVTDGVTVDVELLGLADYRALYRAVGEAV